MIIASEEKPTEETVRYNYSILTTPTLLHVSVEGLQKRRNTIIDISTTVCGEGNNTMNEHSRFLHKTNQV